MKIKDLAVLAEGFDPKSEVSVEVELASGDLLETYAIGWGGNECDGLQLRVSGGGQGRWVFGAHGRRIGDEQAWQYAGRRCDVPTFGP